MKNVAIVILKKTYMLNVKHEVNVVEQQNDLDVCKYMLDDSVLLNIIEDIH